MRAHFVLCSAIALGCVSACASRPTQLIVDVTRESPAIEASYSVRGAAQGEAFDPASESHPLVWPGTAPATIAIVPEGNDASRRALIELTTTSAPSFTVRRIVNGYTPGQLTRISMHVGAPCTPDCLGTQSCEDGVCVTTPGTLSGADAGMVGSDAGIGADAPVPDAPVPDAPVPDAPVPMRYLVMVNEVALATAIDVDVSERGAAAVLFSDRARLYNPDLTMLTMTSSVLGFERIALANATDAWMASGATGLLHAAGDAPHPFSIGSARVAAANDFALLLNDSARIQLRAADDGDALDIPTGAACAGLNEWTPSAVGGLRSIAARAGTAADACDRFAVASRTAVWVSDGSPVRDASGFGECFVGSSPACSCPVIRSSVSMVDSVFGDEVALGRGNHVATTSDLGVRFPGAPEIRPLEVEGGTRSVSIGEFPVGGDDRFLIAYIDTTGAHVRVWGPAVQCRPTGGFDLSGTFARVRISDCVDGLMTMGVSRKVGSVDVTLLRLTCG